MGQRRQGRPKVDVWYDVSYNDRRHGRKENNERKKDEVTKFFVSNLPGKCSSADLKEVFQKYGDYQGSYIARKLDRLGKRFGFVMFRKVADTCKLENDMKDVWIGSYKLFVCLARFVDGERGMRRRTRFFKVIVKKRRTILERHCMFRSRTIMVRWVKVHQGLDRLVMLYVIENRLALYVRSK